MFCLILVLLCVELHTASGDTFYIVTSSSSPCPGEFFGIPCITLQWYTSYPSQSQNVTLFVESGYYNLSSVLAITDTYNFTLVSTNATVTCTTSSTRFTFDRVQYVHISGITFRRCNTAIRMTNVAYAVLTRNIFTNSHLTFNSDYRSGGCLHLTSSLVVTSENRFQNNLVWSHGGAIYAASSSIIIDRSEFLHCTTDFGNGGAIASYSSSITVNNSAFSHNAAGTQYSRWFPDYYGGAIYIQGSVLSAIAIDNSIFSHNKVYKGFGGAVYVEMHNNYRSKTLKIKISRTTFCHNIAVKKGGAMHINCNTRPNACITKIDRSMFTKNIANTYGGAVTAEGTNSSVNVTISSFISNTAKEGGGAIYFNGLNSNITLSSSIFNNNSASFCGVLDVDNYKHIVNLTNSVFTKNTATRQDIGGGVACILNASINIINSTFRHNYANNHAGVFLIDESTVMADSSSFINNTAAVDGGVFHTYVHASDYIIRRSQFSSNRAGDDGGVLFIGRLDSFVNIDESLFDFNSAVDRGGVIAIIASRLYMEINHTNIFNNTAQYGGVVSACNSQITFLEESLNVTADPVLPFCMLYEGDIHDFNITLPPDPVIQTQPPITTQLVTTETQSTTTEPVTTHKVTTEPTTTQPGTTLPVTTQQMTTEPMTSQSATTESGTTQLGTTQPGTTQPGTTHPGTTQPGTTQPGTTWLGTTQPGTAQPGTTRLRTTQPRTAQPGTTRLGTTQPGTTRLGTTQPGTTQPGTTQLGTTQPGTTEPGTTQLGTTQLGTTEPMTTQPVTTEPRTTRPGTTEPTTTEPVKSTRSKSQTIPMKADSNLISNILSTISLTVSFLLSIVVIVQGIAFLWLYYHIKEKCNVKERSKQELNEISRNEHATLINFSGSPDHFLHSDSKGEKLKMEEL